MGTVYCKHGDSACYLTDTLTLGGSPVDLTTASEVICLLKPHAGGDATELAASVVEAAAGTVKSASIGAVAAGSYLQEWQVTFAGGAILTFPNTTFNAVHILADLGN